MRICLAAANGTDALSGRLRAAGLGKRYRVRAAAGEPRSSFDQGGEEIRFDRPVLPDFLDKLHLRGLQARHGVVDILLRRYGSEVSVDITRRQGKVPIVIVR